MTAAPLTEKQLLVLYAIERTGRSGPPQVERNAFLGRMNTVDSLIRRGLVARHDKSHRDGVLYVLKVARCGKRCAERGCRTPASHPLGLKYCVPCAKKVSAGKMIVDLCRRCRTLAVRAVNDEAQAALRTLEPLAAGR